MDTEEMKIADLLAAGVNEDSTVDGVRATLRDLEIEALTEAANALRISSEPPATLQTRIEEELWLRYLAEVASSGSVDDLAGVADRAAIGTWEQQHRPLPSLLRGFLTRVSAGYTDMDETRRLWFGEVDGESEFEPFFVTAQEHFAEHILPYAPDAAEQVAKFHAAVDAIDARGQTVDLADVEPSPRGSMLDEFLITEYFMEANHGDHLQLLRLGGPMAGEMYHWDSVEHGGKGGTLTRQNDGLLEFLIDMVTMYL